LITVGRAELAKAVASGEFSIEAALACAEHSQRIYEPFYEAAARGAGFDRSIVFDRGGCQVAVSSSPDLVLITCQGSTEARDWWSNFRSICREGWPGVLPSGASVGGGFLRQTQSVAADVFEAVADRPGARIVITGHSLGAAVANLLAVWIREAMAPRRIITGYVFESPRVGNDAWAASFDTCFGSWWSVVNVYRGQVDVVTRVPKRRWGFHHCGQRVIVDGGFLHFGRKAWREYRDRQSVSDVAAWRVVSRLALSVQAHSAERVVAALRGVGSAL
jgi:Lipase (class 3)